MDKTNAATIEGGAKETMEAILVAFMLAFIFRAFVVEAFVIPTGSMAPTLLGAHMRFRCPDCGYQFDVNYQGKETESGDMVIEDVARGRTFSVFCPNCGFRMPKESLDDPQNDAFEPAVRYGDRILVLKFLYLLQEPKRWDVVVFKAPVDPRRYDYSQNYIKRLVGKPGESVLVLDGDIYIGKGKDLNSFQVQSKPRKVQQALWRIVYDNDFHPRQLDRSKLLNERNQVVGSDPAWEQPWKVLPNESGWNLTDSDGGRDFKFSNDAGAATIQFDPSSNPNKYALTDWLAYDVSEGQFDSEHFYYTRPSTPLDNYNVSDAMVEFYYQHDRGEGPLRVQLTKQNHQFEAAILANQASLWMDGKLLAGPVTLPANSAARHIEFSNADYRVALRVDDQDVIVTTPEQYHPDIPALIDAFKQNKHMSKPEIRISAERQDCTISHVKLWRDIYYLNRDKPGRGTIVWGTPMNFPNGLMQLGEDEFFVMGDNSFVSSDARYWQQPIDLPHEELSVDAGRVPRRFMLGKAFFVYWPAGYRPIDSAPAIVPDFGDMRFIH